VPRVWSFVWKLPENLYGFGGGKVQVFIKSPRKSLDKPLLIHYIVSTTKRLTKIIVKGDTMKVRAKLEYFYAEIDNRYRFRLFTAYDGRDICRFKVQTNDKMTAINEFVHYLADNGMFIENGGNKTLLVKM